MDAIAIGLGELGRREATALADIDGVRIVGGADPAKNARSAFKADHDVPTYETHGELLAKTDADLANIVTPHTLHYEAIKACLERDIHVHVEKPFVTQIEHGREVIDLAEKRDLVLAVGYQRHFDPRYRAIRELIDEGAIGEPHTVSCHLEQWWHEFAANSWRGKPSLSGGGQLSDSGSHLLDAVLWTTRSEPTAVAAMVDDYGLDVDVNSALAATLDRDGTQITASISVSGAGQSTPAPGESIRILGSDGMIRFDGKAIQVTAEGETTTKRPKDVGFDELTARKLQNTVDAIRGTADLQIPAADGLAVTKLTLGAYEAAVERQTVQFE